MYVTIEGEEHSIESINLFIQAVVQEMAATLESVVEEGVDII